MSLALARPSSPGEAPADWWENTAYAKAARDQARLDGGKTGNADPFVCYYHDVPRALAEEALRRERGESSTAGRLPWPLDAWPNVRTKFILCKDDRLFPGGFAEHIIVDSRFAFRLPPQLHSAGSAPLLSSGLTVFAAILRAKLPDASRVAVLGAGGLGHLAIQRRDVVMGLVLENRV